MKVTRVLTVDPVLLTEEAIHEASELLRAGELVAFPTETVYGLGANAFDPQAVARIFDAKGRPATDPLIVHIASPNQLEEVATDIPELARQFIKAFWPGPLTLVLSRSVRIAPAVSAGLSTIAVRIPAHPIALALLNAAQIPIAAPSANRFGHSSPTTARHVLDDLNGTLPLILDGGATMIGVESTILDLSTDHPRLLRPGGIALDVLLAIAPNIEVVTRFARPEDGAAPAPGMLLRHYAPRAELRLFDGPDEAVRSALANTAHALLRQGKRIGLLVADEDRPFLDVAGMPVVNLGPLTDLEQVARRLFAGLRELDDYAVEIILARSYPPAGMGLAIRDRLLRAAEGRVIHVDEQT